MVTAGDPVQDLAWYLLLDRHHVMAFDVDPAARACRRASESIARWEAASGHSAEHLEWYELLGAARYASIMVRVMKLLDSSGVFPGAAEGAFDQTGTRLLDAACSTSAPRTPRRPDALAPRRPADPPGRPARSASPAPAIATSTTATTSTATRAPTSCSSSSGRASTRTSACRTPSPSCAGATSTGWCGRRASSASTGSTLGRPVPGRGDRGPEDAALHARRRRARPRATTSRGRATCPAFQEPPHVDRNANGRAFLDACRLAQLGSWSGWLEVDGERYDVTPDHWWGSRDRSWGIRPVGEAEAPGNLAAKPAEPFRWLYAPFRMEDHAMVFICQERGDGSRVLEEAVRLWPDGRVDHLGRPEHDLQWNAAGPGLFGLVEKGTHPPRRRRGRRSSRCCPVHIGVGTGYGFDGDGWKHGAYQGDLEVQGKVWDLSTDEGRGAMFGIVDSVARFESTARPAGASSSTCTSGGAASAVELAASRRRALEGSSAPPRRLRVGRDDAGVVGPRTSVPHVVLAPRPRPAYEDVPRR